MDKVRVTDLLGTAIMGVLNTERGPVGTLNLRVGGIPVRFDPTLPRGVLRLEGSNGERFELDLRVTEGATWQAVAVNA